MKRGFTLLEILTVLFLLGVIISITAIVVKPQIFFQRTRDLKRINDLRAMEIAIKTYIISTSTPVLGPNNLGVGESYPSVFISVPYDKEDKRNVYVGGFYIYQVSSSNLIKINGQGWLPINFTTMLYLPLNTLPIDPINSYSQKYFYAYVFKRNPPAFEINANLEYPPFTFGGNEDKESTDGGNNPYIFEVGTDKNLMTNVY